jgi:hypothetical protein
LKKSLDDAVEGSTEHSELVLVLAKAEACKVLQVDNLKVLFEGVHLGVELFSPPV